MNFAHPERLALLLMLFPIALRAVRAHARRRREWRMVGQGGRPPRAGGLGWTISLVFLIIALAQPRWGRPDRPSPPGHDVVLAVDVSRSMAAQDATPDRLGLAISEAESLLAWLGKEPGNRVAVLAFAGRGVLRCPLTEHLGAARETLHELRPGEVEPGGSDLGAALDAALDAFDEEDHTEGRTIVIFSDGENHDDAWKSRLAALAREKVIVHAVTIGDADRGHEIPVGRSGEPLKYRGDAVLSRRSDRSLSEIAKATGGTLVPLGLARADLGDLYRTRIEPGERRRRETLPDGERAERFPIFVGLALGVGVVGAWNPSRRRGLLAIFLLVTLGAGPGGDLAGVAVARGRLAFASGDYNGALTSFEEAIRRSPTSAIPYYDAAEALYGLGRYPEAASRYREARRHGDAGLRAKVDFALGNTSLRLGDIASAIRHYDDCLASGVFGSVYNRLREDAAINRRFAEQHRPPPESPDDSRDGRETPKDGRGSPSSKSERKDGSGDAPRADGGNDPANQPPSEGSNRNPPSEGAGSPDERLASALQAVRDAMPRLSDALPKSSGDKDRKDW